MKRKILLFATILIMSFALFGCTSPPKEDYFDESKQEIIFENIHIEIPYNWKYDADASNETSEFYKEYENDILKNMFYLSVTDAGDISGADPEQLASDYANGLASNPSVSNVSTPEIQAFEDYPSAVITFNQSLTEYDDYFSKIYVIFKDNKIISIALASLYDDFELFDTAVTLAYIDDNAESTSSADISNDSSESTATLGQQNALSKALDYLAYSAFSYTGLIDQLEYEGYTTEEATYAADNCGADWNEQAARKAQEYLDSSSFSRAGLIEQLEYEGFTYDQAVYGVTSVGY